MTDQPYRRLVLSGGAQKGFVQLGVLTWLYSMNHLSSEHLIEAAGTSIGSIQAFLLLLGLDPMTLYQHALTQDLIPHHRLDWNLLWTQKGLVPMDVALEPLKIWLTQIKGRWDYTFQDLMDMGKQLHVIATDIQRSQEIVYNGVTSPTMMCLDAIGKSCNIMGLFTENLDDQSRPIIDGGYTNNFPWTYLEFTDDAIGIAIYDDIHGPSLSVQDYMFRCLSLMISKSTMNLAHQAMHHMKVVDIPYGHMVPIIEPLSPTYKHTLFKEGYAWAHMTLNSLPLRIPRQVPMPTLAEGIQSISDHPSDHGE